MTTLVESSPTTLRWLSEIRQGVEKMAPSLEYGEGEYWAFFKSREKGRNVVQLNPRKKQIRIFTKLDLSFDKELQQTLSSSGYAELYPSTFFVKSEVAIPKAIKFIISSYELDLRL